MAAEKSLVVQGKTIEEALQRGAVLLHCPIESIGHEILSQPGFDRGGPGRTPYKLRVIPVASAPSVEEAEDVLRASAIPYAHEELAAMPSERFLHLLGENVALQPTSRSEDRADPPALLPPRRIEGDVTMTTGAVRHRGDVVVHGNVLRGATVRAVGTITVNGDVEAATLDAEQDIAIAGGMLGTARSAHGGISCRFAQGANMVCAARLVVLESAIHSQLTGGDEVEIGDAMIGGSAYARRQINIRVVGSESGTQTQLAAGMNRALREDADRTRRQAARLIERSSACTHVIQTLGPSEESGIALSVSKRIELWNAMSEKAQINDRLSRLSQTKSRLIAQINEDHAARIKISDRVYPPTQIEVDDVGMTVKAVTQYATFSKDYEADVLRVTSYR